MGKAIALSNRTNVSPKTDEPQAKFVLDIGSGKTAGGTSTLPVKDHGTVSIPYTISTIETGKPNFPKYGTDIHFDILDPFDLRDVDHFSSDTKNSADGLAVLEEKIPLDGGAGNYDAIYNLGDTHRIIITYEKGDPVKAEYDALLKAGPVSEQEFKQFEADHRATKS